MENNKLILKKDDKITNKIYAIRGIQVMLDEDLAELYEVAVKALNQAVKRNTERFPKDFMFQLTENELNLLRSQFVTTKSNWSKKRFLPYVFTQEGVAMLSSIIKSKIAISVNILVMRAFIHMRRIISSNILTDQRLDKVEQKQLEHDQKFEQVFDAIESKQIKPEKGIFYNGQIFDAYKFISDLIRSAKKEIILIYNFIDDSVLTLFSKRNKNVNVIIYTKTISEQLVLDLKKFNLQYPKIKIKEFNDSHDRFMIIDNKDLFHIGASLKDLGKNWFAFSKFNKDAIDMLKKLKE